MVGAAATDISIHGGFYFLLCWLLIFFKKGSGGHNLSSLAITTLGNIYFIPCQLDRVVAILGKPFYGSNLTTAHRRYGQGAGTYCLFIHMHRTGTTLGDATGIFGAYQTEMIPQYPH